MKHAFLITLLAALTAITVDGRQQSSTPPRVVHVVAERFAFTPSRITIDEGETIELRITSDDTAHGFRLVGTSTSLVIPKRGKGVVTVTLTGLTPGKYTFECNRMCGAAHHFMRGVLTVTPASGGEP